MTIPDTDILRRWLLHQLPATQAEALEERLFDDDATHGGDFAAALREAEHDLVDDYARGRLGADERAAFERHLLQTAHDRSHLVFARALATKADTAPPAAHRAMSGRGAAAPAQARRTRRRRLAIGGALAASFAAALLVLSGIRPPTRPIAPESTATTGTSIQTIALLASAQRGANDLEAKIAHGTDRIRLQVEIAQPRAGERYGLRVADGARIVFAADELPLQQAGPYAYVEATLPASVLGAGVREISVRPQGSDAAAVFVWTVRATVEP